jgi:hypothetical protein
LYSLGSQKGCIITTKKLVFLEENTSIYWNASILMERDFTIWETLATVH